MFNRILVHDFAGHPFQFQLSRELARRGHQVLHAYFSNLQGPKGKFSIRPEEAERLSVEGIVIPQTFQRYSYVQRLRAHSLYLKLLLQRMEAFRPDVVISGNTPTEIQYRLSKVCLKRQSRFVHWIQDLYPLALEKLLMRRVGVLGKVISAPFRRWERKTFAHSDAVVYISDDFCDYATAANLAPKRSVVIENWACLEDVPECAKANDWSRAHSLADKFVFLYSGTMGMKHNPETVAALARRFKNRPDVHVVVVSEGIGRRYLEERKEQERMDNLVLLDFQPYTQLPSVLGGSDVLLANIEPESSMFSVPSKVLTYFCAGRPVLLSAPPSNLAARVVERASAGLVCDPADPSAFVRQAEAMYADREACLRMGANARRYAERTFDISRIADMFESVLSSPAPISFPSIQSVPASSSAALADGIKQ